MKSNRFSKYFVNKSDDDLQAIVVSDKHVLKAKQAAYWELESRNLTPQTELPEETPSISRYNVIVSEFINARNNTNLINFGGVRPMLDSGHPFSFIVESNGFNPTLDEVAAGNCSL